MFSDGDLLLLRQVSRLLAHDPGGERGMDRRRRHEAQDNLLWRAAYARVVTDGAILAVNLAAERERVVRREDAGR
jgi:hypothetical protein